METPLISCVMLTRNRPEFAVQALQYFLRQDYRRTEFIVIDDGEHAVGDLLPRDQRIRYVYLQARATPTRKRTMACEMARGSLIAHWSDVDWIGPRRLSLQAAELMGADADLCAWTNLLHYCLDEGQAWRYAPAPSPARPWLSEATLLYRRSAWMDNPFSEEGRDPGGSLAQLLPGERMCLIDNPDHYVAVLLAGDRGLVDPRDPAWQRRPVQEVAAIVGHDRSFYITQRCGHRAVPAATTQTSLTLAAPFFVYDGIGSMAEYLALGLARAGATVNLLPYRVDRAGTTDEFQDMLARSQPDPAAPMLCFGWLGESMRPLRAGGDLFINTMWESSRVPARYIDKLNGARAVIVPTRAVANVFRQSGVVAPVEVVPQGIDRRVYAYEERPERQGLTTLIVASFTPRKNIMEGVAAWKAAFAGQPLARLIIKSRFGYHRYIPDDPRITFVDTEEATRGIAHWYRRADILLALGNEGFGLPLIEGMATGLPVIALDAEGQSDVCQAAQGCLLPVKPARVESAGDALAGACGTRGVPAVADVAERLRWIDTHRDAARTLGRAASIWALEHRDVWAMGPRMLDVVEHYLAPARTLRRFVTVWMALGAGPRARLAGDLARHLPFVYATTEPPDLRRVSVLHIDVEPNTVDEGELAAYVQQAAVAGIPVVVSEREPGAEAHAWEQQATVLAAYSAADAARLQARWPGKRVEALTPYDWPHLAERHLALWRSLESA